MNLIDHLPRDSYFAEALLDDDEFGEQIAAMPAVAPRERISEWGPLREGMARIEDVMRAVHVTIISALSEQAPQFEPALRPVTAVERWQQQARRRHHEELTRRLLPGG